MGLKLVKESGVDQIPIFQKEFEVAQGGFLLDTIGLPPDELVTPGTPVGFDEVTRKVTVLKTAVLYANAIDTETNYQVKKGHFLTVGEDLGAEIGGAAYAITAIDTSNADYDVITIGPTLGVVLTVGDVLFKSSANGAAVGALHLEPKGLLFDNVKIEDNASCGVILRGTVYKRRVANGIHLAVIDALPLIVFSESY
jgi:hypothetical protein